MLFKFENEWELMRYTGMDIHNELRSLQRLSGMPIVYGGARVGGGTGKSKLFEGDCTCQFFQNQSRLYPMGLTDTLTLPTERYQSWLNFSRADCIMSSRSSL